MKKQRKGGVSARKLASMIADEVEDTNFILYEGKGHGSSEPDFLKEALSVSER